MSLLVLRYMWAYLEHNETMKSSFTDQILESLLEESLGGKSPPDLKQRILSAWESEQAGAPQVAEENSESAPRPLIVAELVKATPAGKINEFDARPIRPAPSSPEEAAQDSARPSSRASSPAWRAILSLSAVGLLAVAGWSLVSNLAILGGSESNLANGGNTELINGNAEESAKKTDRDGLPRPLEPSIAAGDKNAGEENSDDPIHAGRPQQLDLDNLPFDDREQIAANELDAEPIITLESSRPDAAIVASLDGALRSLWSDVGAEPTPPEEDTILVQKLAERFSAKPQNATGKLAAIRSLVQSPGFSKDIAQYFSKSWLGDRIAQQPEGRELRGFLQASIFRGHSFAKVASTLLGGEIGESTPAGALVGRLAGNGNHTLAQRLGSSFLNAQLACARCHDSHSTATLSSDLATQENYWSFIALLKGINVARDGDKRLVYDRQKELFAGAKAPTAFFELLDGRMRAAQPVLPDGTNWRELDDVSPRRGLAEWVASSKAFDQAIVNQVWAYLAGRSLVPQVAISDLAGLQARRDIQELLAEEFRASGHDVRRLATWILASEVMERTGADLQLDTIRLASQERLDELLLQQAVFAAAAPTDNSKSFEENVRIAMALRGEKESITLAQPDLDLLGSKSSKKRQTKQNVQALPVSFALYGERPAQRTEQYVDSLLDSQRLSWSDRVRHVALLQPQPTGDGRIQFLAQSLLQQHNGNARAALLDLVWAITSAN